MDKTKFFKHAKIGDTVGLKKNLIPSVYCKEMEKYSDKGLRITKLFPQSGGFMTEECAWFVFTPEMVERLVPKSTLDETIAESFIKNIGENQAAEVIDTLLKPGDKVRIKKNVENADDLWGCNYIYGHMLLPDKEAEIVNKLNKSEHSGKGERHVLDKDHVWVYSTPMFDLAYTITENKHILDTIKEMYNLPANMENQGNIIESQSKDDSTLSPQDNVILNELEKRLAKLEFEIKLIKEQIERIGTILLNS